MKTQNKIFITDLDYLCYFMLQEIPKECLKDPRVAKISRFKATFLIVLKLYYCYCLFQDNNQLTVLASTMFPHDNTARSIKVTVYQLSDIHRISLQSNNLFGNISQLLINVTFELTKFFAKHLNKDKFILEDNVNNMPCLQELHEKIKAEYVSKKECYKNVLENALLSKNVLKAETKLNPLDFKEGISYWKALEVTLKNPTHLDKQQALVTGAKKHQQKDTKGENLE